MSSIPHPRARTSGPSPLAIVSLVLAILALITSPVLVGSLFGVAGLILALLDFARSRVRHAMAWWGAGLSVLGVLSSLAAGIFYYSWYQHLTHGSRSSSRSRHAEASDVRRWEGVAAPALSLRTIDGGSIRLEDLKGRPVVLNFWATWCHACRDEIPHLNRLALESPAGELLIIGVSDESQETLRDFGRKEAIAYPLVSADNLPPPFDAVDRIPTTAFIDREGVIRQAVVGYQDYETLKARARARVP